MTKEEKIQSAINNGTAQILTVDLAKELKGKKIITKYFGYKGQNGVDEFVIGEVKSAWQLAEEDVDYYPKKDARFTNRAEYWKSYMLPQTIREQKNKFYVLTSDGRNTFIFGYPTYCNGILFCSDLDRTVHFIISE